MVAGWLDETELEVGMAWVGVAEVADRGVAVVGKGAGGGVLNCEVVTVVIVGGGGGVAGGAGGMWAVGREEGSGEEEKEGGRVM